MLEQDNNLEHRVADEIIILYGLDINILHNEFQKQVADGLKWVMKGGFKENEESCASFARSLLDAAGIRNSLQKSHRIYDKVITTPDNLQVVAKDAKHTEIKDLPYTADYKLDDHSVNEHIPSRENNNEEKSCCVM